MKQVILSNQQTLMLQDVADEVLCKADEVLIKVKAVTICGSDISYYKADTLPHNLKYPLVLGHEVSGVVVQKGNDVKHLNVGDRVAIEPDQYCGSCKYCKSGHYNFCESLKFMASKGEQGALKEYVTWPAYSVYKIHDEMSFEDGALLEPLSVAYSALEKLSLEENSHVAILGAGSIGILVGILIQKLYPKTMFHLLDLFDEKKQLGIQAGISKEHFLIDGTYDLNDIEEYSDIIDTTGVHSVIKSSLNHSIQGAHLLCVGVSNQKVELSCKDIVYQGLQIIGTYRYANTYPKLLKLIQEKQLDLRHVITARYALKDAQIAFEQAVDTRHNIKVSIMFE